MPAGMHEEGLLQLQFTAMIIDAMNITEMKCQSDVPLGCLASASLLCINNSNYFLNATIVRA